MLRLLHAMVFAALLWTTLPAQQSEASDSTAEDSLPQRGPHDWRMVPVLAGAVVVFAAAPPALFLVPGLLTPDSTRALPTQYMAAYLTGGRIGHDAPSSWTHSENLEIIRGHLFGAVSLEHFSTQERLQFRSIRAGYLFRPNRGVAGGVTLGYRSVTGTRGQDAVLIGLPMSAGSEWAAMRLEPIYAVSGAGVSWTFRWQVDCYFLPRPMLAGLLVEAKPLWQGGPYQGAIALILGVRR
jgi:hypothetical protein